MRIVRGRMPTLEMVNERFARQLRVSLYNLLRKTVELSVGQVTMKKFSEYTHSLALPINLNLVKINPLRGTALFVLDPKLVFAIVDNFFGGVGRHAKIEGREFTPTEMRVVHMLLRSAFADMQEAWTPIANIEVEYLNSEINPNFAEHRHALRSRGGVPVPDRARRRRRRAAHRDAVFDDRAAARSARLRRAVRSRRTGRALARLAQGLPAGRRSGAHHRPGQRQHHVSQLVHMQPGDVLPCDFAGKATVLAEGVPLFRGAFGVSRGQQCVRYEQRIRRPGGNAMDANLLRRPNERKQ